MDQTKLPETGARWLDRRGTWWFFLAAFFVLLAVRSLPHLPIQLSYPRYEDIDAGNIAKDLLDGTLVTGILDYANAPAYTLVKGFLALPFFALLGKLNVCLVMLTFLISCLAWGGLLSLVRRLDGTAAALMVLPVILLLPDTIAANQVNFDANHYEQFLWLVAQLALLLTFARDPRRWWTALLFGVVGGMALFNILSNLVVTAALGLVAAVVLDKRRLAFFALLAAPGFVLFLALRGGVERAAYGLARGSWTSVGTRLWTTLSEGLPAALDFGAVATGPRLLLAALFVSWAALLMLRRAELATGLRNLVRPRVAQIPPAAALDLFLLFFVPLWLGAVSLHAWGVEAHNWRYVILPVCVMLVIPGRLASLHRWGRYVVIAVVLLQLWTVNVWPRAKQLTDVNLRAEMATGARGVLGYHYPLYTKRGLAARILEAPTAAERLAIVSRVPDPWKGWALRDAARRAAYENREPPVLREHALSPALAQAWREGTAIGVTERANAAHVTDAALVLREIAAYLGLPALPPPAQTPTPYEGVGRAIMANFIGLGPPDEVEAWAQGRPSGTAFIERLARLKTLCAGFPAVAIPALTRGMGRTIGDRRLAPATVAKALAQFFPTVDHGALPAVFYAGVGEGEAERQLGMRRSWSTEPGKLCTKVPPHLDECCNQAFRARMARFGLRVQTANDGWRMLVRLEPITP